MPTEHRWYAVFDPRTGSHVDTFDDEDTCHPYTGGDYNGHCGGCGMCCLMQASHYDMVVVKVEPEETETLGDAQGRVAATVKAYSIAQREGPDLQVAYAGNPPCLWCGVPVMAPSMDGPLVCGLCDSGCVQDEDGTVRKWTASEYQRFSKRRGQEIERIRKLNDRVPET